MKSRKHNYANGGPVTSWKDENEKPTFMGAVKDRVNPFNWIDRGTGMAPRTGRKLKGRAKQIAAAEQNYRDGGSVKRKSCK